MRSLPFNFASATGVHALVTLTKPSETLRWTTWNQSVTIGGNTWSPAAGADQTSIQFTGDGSPSNADLKISAITGGLIQPGEATSGALDGLPVKIEIFDIGNIGAGTFDMVPSATIGSCVEDSNNIVTLAVQGPIALAQGPLAEQYTLTCKAALGDNRCKVPIVVPDIGRNQAYIKVSHAGGIIPSQVYGRVKTGILGNNSDYANVYFECTTEGTTASIAPTYDPVVGHTTTDGTAVFTARNAFVRWAVGQGLTFFEVQLGAMPDPRASSGSDPTHAWFVLGILIPRTGPLVGRKIPIRAFDSTTFIVTLFEPYALSYFPVGTQFDIVAGDDLLISTCAAKFANSINFRGTPFVPASDIILGQT